MDKLERIKAADKAIEAEHDKIEEAKEKDALDWAEQEEAKELEEQKKWMMDQLKAEKTARGEDFGDDLSLSSLDDIE